MALKIFLQNSDEYSSHFDMASELWASNSATITIALKTTDVEHPSCASIHSLLVNPVANEYYVYKDLAVIGGLKYVTELSYKCSAATTHITLWDISNSTTLNYDTVTATIWSNYYHEETLPATCYTIQLRIGPDKSNTTYDPFYFDDVLIQGNVLLEDPENPMTYDYQEQSVFHNMIDGSLKQDATPKRINFSLQFPRLTQAQFARMRDFAYKAEPTFYDDQTVPQGIDEGYVGMIATDDYTDTANNKAYYAVASTFPSAVTLWGTEFAGAYASIAVDDDNDAQIFTSVAGDYAYHKFRIQITELHTASEIYSLDILYKVGSDDSANITTPGVVLYGWNGTTWIKIGETHTNDKTTINFTTYNPDIANQFIDCTTTTPTIRLLAKSQCPALAVGVGVWKTTVDSYYLRTIVNADRNGEIPLSNKALLSSGDVVAVENLTRGTTLTSGTDYTIGDDRQSVLTTGITPTDLIRVTYDQYWHVIPTGIQETRIRGSVATAPIKSAVLELTGLNPIK